MAVPVGAALTLIESNRLLGEVVSQAMAVVTELATGYTRGRGFDVDGVPNDDVEAVIASATARLAANGKGLAHRQKVDDCEVEFRSSFNGWTLAELAVLNRYRKRAM